MDKQLAKNHIKKALQNSFDKDRFTDFIKNLLNNIELLEEHPYSGQLIPEAYRQYVNTMYRVGKYIDDNDNKIDVLIVGLKKETSLERARTAQRNFIAWYLNGSRGGKMKDAALVAFVSPNQDDWRFSLVKMEYKLVETPAGKIKAKEDFTPARRWSFLVGRNEDSHTAQKQLLPILQNIQQNPKLLDLENAFNIEVVTKEFFGKYKELFLKTTEELEKIIAKDSVVAADFKEKNVDSVNFAKKLLGQIVFLYFLQKKGWLGVKQGNLWGAGPKNFLRKLFNKEIVDYKNFFNDILEPLFYEALAIDRGKESIYAPFNCRLPFLNGGLFDPINGYDWECTDIVFPDELFSNCEKTKEGDLGTGILDVFDRYNFTVKEDEPLEKEVAIDPEMLGKVFENLLEVKDRKSKGSYYTPREIVHYMCQESLINYLSTELSSEFGNETENGSRRALARELVDFPSKEDIETFIRHGELTLEHDSKVIEKIQENQEYKGKYDKLKMPESIKDNAKLIDKKLANIRVCDPAVGSGAFLVGMMNEIIRARNVLSTYFPIDKDRNMYEFKKHAAQNCLYGVDIDPGAVEIAKLRLWLSLVVDEEDVEEIKPLPNLDYKIMQGNSLLEEFEDVKLFDEELLKLKLKVKRDEGKIKELKQKEKEVHKKLLKWHQENPGWIKIKGAQRPVELLRLENELFNIKQHIKNEINKSITLNEKQETMRLEFFDDTDAIMRRIKDLHKEFFNTSDKLRKEIIKEKISRLEWTLIEATLKEQNKKESLIRLEEYKNSNAKPFFLWKLHFAEVFQEKGGFDVVIANPPYVSYYSRQAKKLDMKILTSYLKKYQFLKLSKKKSINTVMLFLERAIDLLSARKFFTYIIDIGFLEKVYKEIRIFLSQFNIFDIVTDISVFENVASGQLVVFGQKEKIKFFQCCIKKDFVLTDQILSRDDFIEDAINVATKKILSLDVKHTIPLGEIYYITCGLEFGALRDVFLSQEKKSEKYHKVINGGFSIPQKYCLRWEKEKNGYVLFDKKVEEKLVRNGKNISKTGKTVYFISGDEEKYKEDKIFIRQSALEIIATYDTKKYYALRSLFVCNLKNKKYNVKYILAILNSKLITTYALENGIIRYVKGKQPQIRIDGLNRIPVKDLEFIDQKAFISLVDDILSITKDEDYLQNPDKQARVKKYERQIDEMVYKLYDLTPDEIAIVEGISK